MAVISYYDDTDGSVKVAHCSNPACTAATVTTVDTTGDIYLATWMTIGTDGMPLLIYPDATGPSTTVTKIAHCSNVFCVPYFRRR